MGRVLVNLAHKPGSLVEMKAATAAAAKKEPRLVSRAGIESKTRKKFRGWPTLGCRAIEQAIVTI